MNSSLNVIDVSRVTPSASSESLTPPPSPISIFSCTNSTPSNESSSTNSLTQLALSLTQSSSQTSNPLSPPLSLSLSPTRRKPRLGLTRSETEHRLLPKRRRFIHCRRVEC
uniref:Uncharacterized protein n=1 Tax=Brassica oleracea TaxID=3712 RepID=A0A3P6CQ33_BRAOL|nr:unnamed protein product [Brassica oleracea]